MVRKGRLVGNSLPLPNELSMTKVADDSRDRRWTILNLILHKKQILSSRKSVLVSRRVNDKVSIACAAHWRSGYNIEGTESQPCELAKVKLRFVTIPVSTVKAWRY